MTAVTLPMSRASRAYWASAPVISPAEPVPWPPVNPIDAVAGSVPCGDAGTPEPSQSCSGIIPTPSARFPPSLGRPATRLHAIQHAYQAVAGHDTVYTPPEPTRTFRAPGLQASRQIELEAEP